MIMTNVPLRIRAMMKAYKWSAPKLAERAGLPLPSIKSILHGQSHTPRAKTMQALAKAFNCPLSELEQSPEAPVNLKWSPRDVDLPAIGSIREEELVKTAIRVVDEIAAQKEFDLTGKDDLRQLYVNKLVDFAIDGITSSADIPKIDRVYANWLIGKE